MNEQVGMNEEGGEGVGVTIKTGVVEWTSSGRKQQLQDWYISQLQRELWLPKGNKVKCTRIKCISTVLKPKSAETEIMSPFVELGNDISSTTDVMVIPPGLLRRSLVYDNGL
jgi:hypothetical protein